MENEKRLDLINKWDVVNQLIRLENNYQFYKEQWDADVLYRRICELEIGIGKTHTVDAVEAKKYEELVGKYEELVGMYHELRENFVDYVCSGIRNEAPYCLNKCEDCVDKRGWCKLERCQGFNPAEVILYRFAKMDGDVNG